MGRKAGEHAALIAAFRDGLGLSGLAAIREPEGIRLAAVGPDGVASLPAGETGDVRFWCRDAADAMRIVAAAKSKLQPQLRNLDLRIVEGQSSSQLLSSRPVVEEVLSGAAARLHVALYSDDEITGQAMTVIARMEGELEVLLRSGGLKSVNRSYRDYRQDASTRGEKIVPYAAWFRKYKENLVRQIAAALRYL